VCRAGADDFTPLLILAVIRARPSCLASNLAYIERYRYHSRLVSETQYYYIQLVSTTTSSW
jgi:bacterioferritin (cytochrome b1)